MAILIISVLQINIDEDSKKKGFYVDLYGYCDFFKLNFSMNSEQLFELALGLENPWYVERLELVEKPSGEKQLEIHLNFTRGARFKDSLDNDCPVHDTVERTWQHFIFFEHRCFLHARVRRITTSEGKVEQVKVPWARAGSGFTLLFEAFAMCLIENEMLVNKAGNILGVYPNRLWTVFNY